MKTLTTLAALAFVLTFAPAGVQANVSEHAKASASSEQIARAAHHGKEGQRYKAKRKDEKHKQHKHEHKRKAMEKRKDVAKLLFKVLDSDDNGAISSGEWSAFYAATLSWRDKNGDRKLSGQEYFARRIELADLVEYAIPEGVTPRQLHELRHGYRAIMYAFNKRIVKKKDKAMTRKAKHKGRNKVGEKKRSRKRGEVLDRLDTNGDGKIQAGELRSALTERKNSRLSQVDTNKDGFVSALELERAAAIVFAGLDKDKSDNLSRKEFAGFLKQGQKGSRGKAP